MDKKRRVRIVEAGKNVLILALTCSALWLASRTTLMEPLVKLVREEEGQVQSGQTQAGNRSGTVQPLRILANLDGGVRYGTQYDGAAGDALFQQTAALLVETLSASDAPQEIVRRQWEHALTNTTSICFDFQGEVPLEIITGWLTGESSRQTATVRRLALSVRGNWVELYYRDETDGRYFCCAPQVVEASRLEEALSALNGNSALYAFEDEEYAMLDPDTMLLGRTPAMQTYTAANPVPAGQTMLETLAEELDFAINPNGIYYAGEWVARSGNDTLRLQDDGILSYLAEEETGEHFQIANHGTAGALFRIVESCRRLAGTVMESRSGSGQLYLMSAEELNGEWVVEFGYSLNGIPVRMEEGYAARFHVRGDRITRFAMHLRTYAESGTEVSVLPARQAAAALEARGLSGEELLLVYPDHGTDLLSVQWAAADRKPETR